MTDLLQRLRADLDAAHRAREQALPACRRAIRASGLSIRAVHRRNELDAATLRTEAEEALREAQALLEPHPAVRYAGFLHDAEKEYAEAVLTQALVEGRVLPGPADVGVPAPAWLNGVAEAASELRRHALDRLREGDVAAAERLLTSMDDVYDLLVGIDYPDALTGGLRRTTDALRAVVERTRSDVTIGAIHRRD